MLALLVTGSGDGLDLSGIALQTLVALVGVCAIAWWILHRVARSQRKLGGGESLCLEAALSLSARQRVVVVAVDGRRLLLGLGEADAPRYLTELGQANWPAASDVSVNEGLGEKGPSIDDEKE